MHKQQNSAGLPVLVTCAVLAVGVSVVRVLDGGRGSEPVLSDEMEIIRYAAALELGHHLAEEPAGNQALCILNPIDVGNQALQDGLEKGLDGRIPVEFSLLDREAVDGPDATGMTVSMVAALLDQHPNTDLLISMGDLPGGQGQHLAALLRKRGAKLAVARVFDRADLAAYNRAGVFAGAVLYREEPKDIGDLQNATPQDVFAAQFTLLPPSRR